MIDHVADVLLYLLVFGVLLPLPTVLAYHKGRSVPTMIALSFLCWPLALLRAVFMGRDAAVLAARVRRPSGDP